VRIPRISVGPLIVGEDHPLFDLSDFPVAVEGSTLPVEAGWIEGSVRWWRAEDGLAFPQARLRISVGLPPERLVLRWHGRAILLQGTAGTP
jgi:hypothetical protein